jgi:DinB superfamily
MPTRLGAVTAGLGEDLLTTSLDSEWSANEVLAHLRSCSDVWGDSMSRILVEDAPTIRAVNPTTWIESTDYREQDFVRSLRAFAAQRTDLLALLDPLPAADCRDRRP